MKSCVFSCSFEIGSELAGEAPLPKKSTLRNSSAEAVILRSLQHLILLNSSKKLKHQIDLYKDVHYGMRNSADTATSRQRNDTQRFDLSLTLP